MSKFMNRGILLLAIALVLPACGSHGSKSAGNGSSGNTGGTPTGGAPPPPTNIRATPGDRAVTLTWDSVSGATGYTIRSATTPGGPYGLVEQNFGGTTFVDDQLNNGTTYFYVISTVLALTEGPPSAEVSATPQGSLPPPTQTWTRSGAGPVLTGDGVWDFGRVQDPSVLRLGPSSWVMYYSGIVGAGPGSIGRATSSDGVTWTKDSTPVLRDGPGGMLDSWDGSSVAEPHVLFDGSLYRMWYTGIGSKVQIGYATSPDGITWTKAADPVLSPGAGGSWDGASVSSPRVIVEGGVFKMWYQGMNGGVQQIGYATSSDGLVWTKHPTPVLSPVAGSFASGLADLMVVRDASGYRGWFTGVSSSGTRIGYATSSDGITWTMQPSGGPPQPVLDKGAPGAWDDSGVSRPFVVPEGGLLRMWYSGRRDSDATFAIGLATSGS